MSLLLMLLAGHIAANLMRGHGADWKFITIYWTIVFLKNWKDYRREE